jgi:RHS repeat-associated protein
VVTATAAETRHFYFNNQWRAVEERVSGTVMAQYVWNPADRWDLIRRRRSVAGTLDETRFVLRDYLDPAAIINPGGVVTERYRYDAFGPAAVLAPDFSARATSECAWNFLYHAEFIDALTGLYSYGFRFYHPGLGRWISLDPIGEAGGVNIYAFVQNNANLVIDLLGLQLWGISGINSLNKEGTGLENYIDKALASAGIELDRKANSELGTKGFYKKERNVANLCSKKMLDDEAERKASELCPRKWCGKKVCVLMIAPKTATRPPSPSCCNLDIRVWWSPNDPCPNQKLNGKLESKDHWSEWGGQKPCVHSRHQRQPRIK